MAGFGVIKLRMMSWAVYVAHIRGMRNAYSRYHLADLDVDRRVILKCILKKQDQKMWKC
jgi:hypothetical protein